MSSTRKVTNFIMALAAVMVLFIATTSVHSGETKLTAAEIKETLSGNSISGKWRGNYYKQYFDASGTTLYQGLGLADHSRLPRLG